ncbi:MAG: HAMP domain-containing sensor histidine kinase [Acidobacteriota bacterium]
MRRFVWLIPVILVPLGALLTMQYRFLRSLEQTTAQAAHNTLRNAVEEVSRDIEMQFSAATDRALAVSPDTLRSPQALGAHFRGVAVPGARTFFALPFNECGPLSFDSGGWEKKTTGGEARAITAATMTWSAVSRTTPGTPLRPRTIDQRDLAYPIVLKPIMDSAGRIVGTAGVVFDPEVSRTMIEKMSLKQLRGRLHDSYITTRVGAEDHFAHRKGERSFLRHPLGFAFGGWYLGVRDNCATPEEIARSNFRINMLWTGTVGLILAIAIGLAFHAAARQMHLSQMKTDFVSNVSHELRTPLSSIRVFGEYMRLGRVTAPEKIREYGEYIEGESRRLTQLINNILDFSKIESAEKNYRFAELDVCQFVRDAVTAFAMPLREGGIAVVCDSSGEAFFVRADRDALGQVLVNLLDNAVKYSGPKCEVSVRVTSADGEVRVEVEDRGIGIALDEQKKIFEKFYRVGSGLVHDVKGSGLGLAIVHHVARAHAGRIEVTSTPGQGSVFTIVLPRASAPARSTALCQATLPAVPACAAEK